METKLYYSIIHVNLEYIFSVFKKASQAYCIPHGLPPPQLFVFNMATVKFLIVAASLIEAAPQTFKKINFFTKIFLLRKPPIEAAWRLLRFVKNQNYFHIF